MKLNKLFIAAFIAFGFTACTNDEPGPIRPEEKPVTDGSDGPSFFVLNQGAMGSNKSTIDFYDAAGTTATYKRNIYAERNPNAVMELGDVGNDIAIHGDRLYIVLNGSHKVEVCDTAAVSVGHFDVSSPRYIVFDDTYAYVSSFVNTAGDGKGSVQRFRLADLSAAGEVSVGYGPEQMAIVDGTLYVANSQNYALGAFDSTISAIDLANFTAKKSADISVGCNLRALKADKDGNLWVTAQGNFYDIAANFYKIPRRGDGGYGTPVEIGVPCSGFAFKPDNTEVYYYAIVYDADWNPTNVFGRLDAATCAPIEGSLIDDPSRIMAPYYITVEPGTGNIFLTDARNYSSSGTVLCYGADGTFLWDATAGDIPCGIAFLNQ